MLMPYDDFLIYLEEYNKNDRELIKQLIRVLIGHIHAVNGHEINYTDIFQCEADNNTKINIDQLNNEVDNFYKNRWQ